MCLPAARPAARRRAGYGLPAVLTAAFSSAVRESTGRFSLSTSLALTLIRSRCSRTARTPTSQAQRPRPLLVTGACSRRLLTCPFDRRSAIGCRLSFHLGLQREQGDESAASARSPVRPSPRLRQHSAMTRAPMAGPARRYKSAPRRFLVPPRPPSAIRTAKVSRSIRTPARAAKPCARSGSNMVRNESISEAELNGRLGSWLGERAAQRPSTWKIGSAS